MAATDSVNGSSRRPPLSAVARSPARCAAAAAEKCQERFSGAEKKTLAETSVVELANFTIHANMISDYHRCNDQPLAPLFTTS